MTRTLDVDRGQRVPELPDRSSGAQECQHCVAERVRLNGNVVADLGDRLVEFGPPPASYKHLSCQALGGLQVDAGIEVGDDSSFAEKLPYAPNAAGLELKIACSAMVASSPPQHIIAQVRARRTCIFCLKIQSFSHRRGQEDSDPFDVRLALPKLAWTDATARCEDRR
jgi:hypothetical protein